MKKRVKTKLEGKSGTYWRPPEWRDSHPLNWDSDKESIELWERIKEYEKDKTDKR